jgi:hypothetical protein
MTIIIASHIRENVTEGLVFFSRGKVYAAIELSPFPAIYQNADVLNQARWRSARSVFSRSVEKCHEYFRTCRLTLAYARSCTFCEFTKE